MILLGSYVCYTMNTLDTIETFIAEIYVQLVTTESMCYSTGGSTLTDGSPKTATKNSLLTLYCACLI